MKHEGNIRRKVEWILLVDKVTVHDIKQSNEILPGAKVNLLYDNCGAQLE